jgi:secreted PhoX family phosphatase
VLYDKRSKSGYRGQLYFGNEENHPEGRTFAVTNHGLATQLPRLGLFAWENTLVADTGDDETVVIGTDDNVSGQLRIYVGEKQRKGSAVDKAGLTNGELHVLDVKDQTISTDAGYRAAYGVGQQVPVKANQVDWDATGAAQETESVARGLTLNRIEDGAWDPKHPNDFYFFTTEGGDKTSVENDPVTGAPITRDGGGLWRLRFADVSKPSAGMTLELLLDGSEAPYLNKPDNMDIDEKGHLLIQEDPGGNAHLARVLAYEIASGDIAILAEFDPARFASGATGYPATIDEESSGIIDVADLMGRGTFLLDAQIHSSVGLSDPTRQVEHGQLLKMKVNWATVF